MTCLRALGAGLFIGLVIACAAPKVGYDYDTATSFGSYRTYQWMADTQEPTGDRRLDSSLVDGRIRTAIATQLQGKGYTVVPSGQPDFFVAYHIGVKDMLKGASTQHYIGDRASGTYTTTSDIQPYKEGVLLIDIVDGSSKQLVWQGYAQAEVDPGATPRQRNERIERVIEEMFSHFPPQ